MQMKSPLVAFLFLFIISGGTWMLIEYADDKQLTEAEFWYSLGFGIINGITLVVTSRAISWWEKRKAT